MDKLTDTDMADLIACIHSRQSEIADSSAPSADGEEERLDALEARIMERRNAAARAALALIES